MKRLFHNIRLMLTVAGLGTMAACSSEDGLTTETAAFNTSQIEVSTFPSFADGAGSRTIGTPDAGKTLWAEGDVLLLKVEVYNNAECIGSPIDGKTQCFTASYTGSQWIVNGTQSISANAITDYVKFTALYAPNYEWNGTEPVLKAEAQAGTAEYLTSEKMIVSFNDIMFNGEKLSANFTKADARDYSRLRVATTAGRTITLACADFTPAGYNIIAALGTETLTATADEKGNAYFYGKWDKSSTIKITKNTGPQPFYNVETIDKAVSASSTIGQSYALDAATMNITAVNYYQWDAAKPVNNGEDSWCPQEDNPALTSLFKSCPSANEMVKYVKAVGKDSEAGPYWDNGVEGDGYQTFITIMNNNEISSVETQINHSGMWFLKKAYWNDETNAITDNTVSKKDVKSLASLSVDDVRKIRTSGKYFFLPATGYITNSTITQVGESGMGLYWSSTPYINNEAYVLSFYKNEAYVNTWNRTLCCLPWVAE